MLEPSDVASRTGLSSITDSDAVPSLENSKQLWSVKARTLSELEMANWKEPGPSYRPSQLCKIINIKLKCWYLPKRRTWVAGQANTHQHLAPSIRNKHHLHYENIQNVTLIKIEEKTYIRSRVHVHFGDPWLWHCSGGNAGEGCPPDQFALGWKIYEISNNRNHCLNPNSTSAQQQFNQSWVRLENFSAPYTT